MSNYPAFDRDHLSNCPICRPKGSNQYIDKFEGYLKIIQNEISLLNISYQVRVRFEQTVEDVLRSMYLSLKGSETYSPIEFRTEQYLGLESRYNSLLYDYEEERKARNRIENEKEVLENKIVSLLQAQNECINNHLSPSRVSELYSEVSRGKGAIKELEEEVQDLRTELSVFRAKLRDYEQVSSNFASLKVEFEEQYKRYMQVLKELGYYKDTYEKICKESENISSSFSTFKIDYEEKERRYMQAVKEMAYYKDLYDKFKQEYSKDSNSLSQKYENVLKDKEELEDLVRHLKEKNKRLVKKNSHAQPYHSPEFSSRPEHKTDQVDSQNRHQDKNPNTLPPNNLADYLNSENHSSQNQKLDRLKDLEKKIDELKEKIETKNSPQNLVFFEKKIDEIKEKIDQKNEKSFRNLTPSTNFNQPLANDRKKLKEVSESNEYLSKPSPQRRSIKKDQTEAIESNEYLSKPSPQRRSSKKEQTEVPQNRRRSSEFNLTFSSHMRRNSSPVRRDSKKPEMIHCGICHRKHGDEYLNKIV